MTILLLVRNIGHYALLVLISTLGEAADEVAFGGNVCIIGGGATSEVLAVGSRKVLKLL